MLSAGQIKRLTQELTQLSGQPDEGIRVFLNEENLTDVQAEIDGPTGTPYEGGVFRIRLELPQDFPASAPSGYFLTKIFHPNVSKGGEICVNVLKKDWKADLGLRHVLQVVRCLLIEPNPESALNEEAGKLQLEDYDAFAKHARLMTDIHAQAWKRPMPLTTSSANVDGQAIRTAAVGKPADDSPVHSPIKKKPKNTQKDKVDKAKKRTLKRL